MLSITWLLDTIVCKQIIDSDNKMQGRQITGDFNHHANAAV